MIDMKTALLFLGLAGTVSALLLWLTARKSGSERIISVLAWAKLTQGIAFILLSGRGAIPDVLSKNFGNSLLFTGCALECVAAWIFAGRTRWKEVVLPVLVLSILVMNAGIMGEASGGTLVATASFIVAILMIICSMAFLQGRSARSRLALTIGVTDAVVALANVARGATALSLPDFNLLLPGTVQSLATASFLLFLFSNGFGFLLLIKEEDDRQLMKSEAQKTAILNGITTNIAFVDEDLRILWVNRAAAESVDKLPEEMMGRTCHSFWADPSTPCKDCPTVKALQTGKSEHTIMETPDGRVWEEGGEPVFDAEGKVIGVVEIAQDITKRKRTENALRESENRYRSLFEMESDAIFLIDNQTGRILEANRAATLLYGYGRDELLTLKNTDLSAEQADTRRQTQENPIVFDNIVSIPLRIHRKKDGTEFPVEITGRFFIQDGRPVHIAAIRDITERKEAEDERRGLEERLHRAEKMEALGTMAGGVAHDLNNVLGIVVGYSELLVGDLDQSGSARSEATEILKAGERAAGIVQDLLTLTRRGVPSRKVLNLNSILLECQELPEFAKLCSLHPNVLVKTDLETDLLHVAGSSVHLGKSYMNLFSNAMEAMPRGGVATIRTRNQYLDKPVLGYDEVKEGDYVVLSVSDTGEGISPADLKRIFEPFYSKKIMGRSGTGLGLAVVWGTVKDHHGYINVETEEGRGTTFTLYFPVTREEISPEGVSSTVAEYMGNGESILIVDDVKEQRELAAKMLTKLNYSVTTVSSGEEAVAHLSNNAVELVVLDMIMDPGMDGLDTYEKIIEIHPHQNAIIVSGFSETERVSKAQSLGAGAYVKKPYVLERLGLAVRKELDLSPFPDLDLNPKRAKC